MALAASMMLTKMNTEVFGVKLMKTVKKIMALSTGAVMVGATVLSASAAADLGTYPAPFVKDGKFNGLFVVGDSANSADTLGAVDIAQNLQFAARVKKTVQSTAGASVSVSGEAWRVGTSSKKLELSELGTGKKEAFRNITTFVTDDELTTLLADGTFRNSRGDFDYHQYLYFDNVNAWGNDPVSLSAVHTESDDDVTGDFFYVKDGDQVARYSLEFTSSAESETTDSAGTAAQTGTFLWDMEGKSISLLGKTFSIVKARRQSGTGTGVQLTLMGGAQSDSLSQGESKTYTVGGKDYDVSVDFVGSTTAKFIVNGELTDSMQEGNTYTLGDKSLIGVKDITAQEFTGGVRKVEFYLGADKVVLEDTDMTNTVSDTAIKVGEDTLDDTEVIITGTNTSNLYKIDTIQLNFSADTDVFVPAGGKVSAYLEASGSFLNAWDVEYAGLEIVPVEAIKLNPSGSDKYQIKFVDGDGNSVSVPFLYTSGGTNLKFGDDDDDLWLAESGNASISKNDYFVVSDTSQNQGSRSTYVFRYKGAPKNTTTGDKVIKFDKLGQGLIERPITAPFANHTVADDTTSNSFANIQAGGATFRIWAATVPSSDDFNIRVDLNGDGSLPATSLTNDVINITTKSGALISIQHLSEGTLAEAFDVGGTLGNSSRGVVLSVQTLDGDDYDNVAPSNVEFNITAASGELGASEITNTANHNYKSPEGQSTLNYAYTSVGAYVQWENPTSDPDIITIDYPTVQRLPLVYVTAPGASVTQGEATEAGEIVYYETTPISVGSAKLAAEFEEAGGFAKNNAIVIGGPCANAAAAELMGMPQPCGKDFSVGKAMIKLYENASGNVAMLVAGYEAPDTRRAARVVANYAQWQESGKLKGTEVVVSGTSFTDISVAAPAPKVVETVADDTVVAGDDDGTADQGTGDATQ